MAQEVGIGAWQFLSAAPRSSLFHCSFLLNHCLSSGDHPGVSPAPPWRPRSFLWRLLPFLKCVLTEAPQAPLIGSGASQTPPVGPASARGGSVVEPAGTCCDRHKAAPASSHRGPPCSPRATKTWESTHNIPGKRKLLDSRLVAGLSLSL